MLPLPESEYSDENIISRSPDSIKHLYFQIRKMPELTEQARLIDQVLPSRLQEVKGTASAVINQFKAQKKVILQHFDHWIMPIAQEVLDGFLLDAQQLKRKLEDKLEHLDQTTSEEWEVQANQWAQLYSRWNDRKGLVNKILEVVIDRTKHLIDKDVQVIHDYQSQSLANLPEETETFKNVEERLTHATAEPLKQLMNLRNEVKENSSLQQASEWVAKLQERRESYFDQLLMKIDHVMKDVVNLEETKDWTAFVELEGEVLFMERELHHINSDLTHLHLVEESDKQFLLGRLEGLLDHVTDLDNPTLPSPLQIRMQALKAGILLSISRLEK
jgi:hypothetical protein